MRTACCAARTFIFLLLLICPLEAATNKKPVLLSQAASTRAIALESVTFRAEPFSPTTDPAFSADTRTRICIFAMNLELLPGEGSNAFSSDVQDSTGKLYPLRVEFVGQVPNFPGITMIVVRLADDLGDTGDVLLRVNLHGMSSNRVRVAIGHSGGGPADDAGSVPTPAPDTPPGADPPLVPDPFTGPASDADTVRFLEQASWGPTTAEIARVKAMGFKAYLDEQFSLAPTNPGKGSNYPDLTFPLDDQNQQCPTTNPADPNYNQNVCTRDFFTMYPVQRNFFSNALYGNDQLRQRVAFALHQILVVSGSSEVNRPSWMTPYLQALDRNAFGSYRTLLNEITLTPAMGEFLDMRLSSRTNPNENFAREVLQLFSVGTDLLNPDGTLQRDAQGNTIPTYTQADVNEFTRVFTGWGFNTAFTANITNYRDPMVPRGGTQHDTGAKTLLNGFTIPACSSSNATCAQSDMTAVMNHLANHPNVGPFLSKQLIQHLVTSNPSPAYVERVARVFNNDCNGLYPQGCTNTRGNLKFVVQAILLDPEARGDVKTDPNYGKLREPAQYVNGFLRAFNVKSFDKTTTSDGVLGQRGGTDFTGTLDQAIFMPPTVFSYYQPGYEVPGTKLLGPAFGILSTTTTLRRANDINTLVYNGVTANTTPTAGSPDRPRGTSIDISNLEALAGNPSDVVNALDALMFHGTMQPQMRTSIITAMNTINDANVTTRNQKRARTAVYLAATSSQYDIQR
ncbi:MAG TPA: DUF1800 domain-containing protein [Pyrinomonadaceae bacterium]|nr:DUF1800 domain-containing protein [Pyrinomonadaceae bacterium]